MTRTDSKPEVGGPRSSDRGSMTITMLGVGMAIVVLAGLAATVSKYVVIHRRVAIAADLAALAGARYTAIGEAVACSRAGQVGKANGATVVECQVKDLDLVVTAAGAAPAGIGTVRATARAGPIGRTVVETDPVGTGHLRRGVCVATTEGGTRRPLARSMVRCDWGWHAGLATRHRQGGPHGAVDGDSHRWRPYGARGWW